MCDGKGMSDVMVMLNHGVDDPVRTGSTTGGCGCQHTTTEEISRPRILEPTRLSGITPLNTAGKRNCWSEYIDTGIALLNDSMFAISEKKKSTAEG